VIENHAIQNFSGSFFVDEVGGFQERKVIVVVGSPIMRKKIEIDEIPVGWCVFNGVFNGVFFHVKQGFHVIFQDESQRGFAGFDKGTECFSVTEGTTEGCFGSEILADNKNSVLQSVKALYIITINSRNTMK
jgi:hypothetical protein